MALNNKIPIVFYLEMSSEQDKLDFGDFLESHPDVELWTMTDLGWFMKHVVKNFGKS